MHPGGEAGPFRIDTGGGGSIPADVVVLALGHQAPQDLVGWELSRDRMRTWPTRGRPVRSGGSDRTTRSR